MKNILDDLRKLTLYFTYFKDKLCFIALLLNQKGMGQNLAFVGDQESEA